MASSMHRVTKEELMEKLSAYNGKDYVGVLAAVQDGVDITSVWMMFVRCCTVPTMKAKKRELVHIWTERTRRFMKSAKSWISEVKISEIRISA